MKKFLFILIWIFANVPYLWLLGLFDFYEFVSKEIIYSIGIVIVLIAFVFRLNFGNEIFTNRYKLDFNGYRIYDFPLFGVGLIILIISINNLNIEILGTIYRISLSVFYLTTLKINKCEN